MNTPYLVLDENAQYFECGFSCDNAVVLRVSDSEKYFITDSRYTLEAQQCANKSTQIIENRNLCEELASQILKLKLKNITFNPSEITISFFQNLVKNLGASADEIKLNQEPNFHQKLRIIKSDSEISLIRKSQELNRKAFKNFAKFVANHGFKGAKKGDGVALSERDLHFFASTFLSESGRFDLSFNPIVGLNATGAKPHALPSSKIVCKKGDLLLFDAGIKYKRYCSDRTRTALVWENMSFSKTQNFKSKKQQKIYDIVRKAQERAIEKARAGMKASEIDALARDVIQKAGYGEFFVHSLGHGIGLDIHELPIISARSDEIVQDGMVFSIEPGIYLPNEFGVRIEDLVVMKNSRAQIL